MGGGERAFERRAGQCAAWGWCSQQVPGAPGARRCRERWALHSEDGPAPAPLSPQRHGLRRQGRQGQGARRALRPRAARRAGPRPRALRREAPRLGRGRHAGEGRQLPGEGRLPEGLAPLRDHLRAARAAAPRPGRVRRAAAQRPPARHPRRARAPRLQRAVRVPGAPRGRPPGGTAARQRDARRRLRQGRPPGPRHGPAPRHPDAAGRRALRGRRARVRLGAERLARLRLAPAGAAPAPGSPRCHRRRCCCFAPPQRDPPLPPPRALGRAGAAQEPPGTGCLRVAPPRPWGGPAGPRVQPPCSAPAAPAALGALLTP